MKAEFVGGLLYLACAKRREGGRRRRRKEKLPLFEYLSERVEEGVSIVQAFFGGLGGGRENCSFFLFCVCAMNKDIPADLNCVFLRYLHLLSSHPSKSA